MKFLIACLVVLLALNIYQFTRISSLQSQHSKLIADMAELRTAVAKHREPAPVVKGAPPATETGQNTRRIEMDRTYVVQDEVVPGLIEVLKLNFIPPPKRVIQYTEDEMRAMRPGLDFGLYHDPLQTPAERAPGDF